MSGQQELFPEATLSAYTLKGTMFFYASCLGSGNSLVSREDVGMPLFPRLSQESSNSEEWSAQGA